MPTTTERSGTRQALTDAARRVFAQRGYDGASVRAITAEAGANLGAVTYHFGSKRALYLEVLEQVLTPLVQRIEQAVSGPGTPEARLEGAVRAFFDHLARNPDQPLLVLQEIAAGKQAPRPVRQLMKRTITSLTDVVRQGQAQGTIRPGDPFLMVLSLASQPVYLSLVSRALGGEAGPDWNDPDFRAAVVEHAVTFVRAGLSVDRDDRSTPEDR